MESIYELYRLVFPNGKLYFGISVNSDKRLRRHIRRAREGFVLPVYAAIRKYGAPKLEQLLVGRRSFICAMEVAAIAEWKTRDRRYGYNVSPGGDSNPMDDPRARAKLSATLRRRFMEPAFAEASRRATTAPGVLTARSIGMKKKWATDQTYASICLSAMHSDEAKRRSRAWRRANPPSVETRAKLSATMADSMWITDGSRSFRVHRRVPLPNGWKYGRAARADGLRYGRPRKSA